MQYMQVTLKKSVSNYFKRIANTFKLPQKHDCIGFLPSFGKDAEMGHMWNAGQRLPSEPVCSNAA